MPCGGLKFKERVTRSELPLSGIDAKSVIGEPLSFSIS